MVDNDPRDFTLMRAEDLQPGDVLLSWDGPSDPADGMIVQSVDRVPRISYSGEVTYSVNVTYVGGWTTYGASGLRKVQRPAA